MAKLPIMLVLFFRSSILIISNGESLFKDDKTSIIPTFRVYLHESMSEPNKTLYEVARADITTTSPTMFGQTVVADDFIKAGPDPDSQNLGRAQGVVVSTALMNDMAISLELTFVFTAGSYRGSSITIVGRKLVFGNNQEIPIVGGTGFFRLARGYSISSLYSYDPIKMSFVNTYDFYVAGLVFFANEL